MAVFPTGLPAYTITGGGDTANGTAGGLGLSGLLNAFEVDVTALATKMGTGASTPAAGKVLRANGTGTSVWGAVDITTDVASFTSANLATIVSDETGTGSLVFASSPTIVTPTIASFTNAQHNHSNAAGGGKITSTGITSVDWSQSTVSNPYKFRVRRVAAQNSSAGAFTKINFDTEDFDTNNNFDSATNFRYTAPVSGFYQVNGGCSQSANGGQFVIAALYKNGSIYQRGVQQNTTAASLSTYGDLVQLAANDYIELFVFASNTVAIDTSAGSQAYFSGILMCHT